jgi:hypothetical protein
MLFRQRKEFFEQKKKDISEKLKYIGLNDKNINMILVTNYDFFGRITGSYKILERQINNSYESIKELKENYEKLQNLAKKFPRIVYN